MPSVPPPINTSKQQSSGSNTPSSSTPSKRRSSQITTPKIDHTKKLFQSIRSSFTSSGTGNANHDDPHEVLTSTEIARYRSAFESFADEGTETITLDAIGKIMNRMFQHPTQAELKEMIREVDENNDQEVDFEEFLILVMHNKTKALVSEKELIDEAFSLFDQDNTGFISPENLKVMFQSLMSHDKDFEPMTEEECKFMIKEVKNYKFETDKEDDEDDFFLTKGEFVKLMKMKTGERNFMYKVKSDDDSVLR